MSKFYFIKNRDPEKGCMTKDGVKDYMLDHGEEIIDVHPAIMDTKSDYFYCRKLHEIGEVGESCGKSCKYYSPRNGKSGRCRFSANLYYPDFGETLTIKL